MRQTGDPEEIKKWVYEELKIWDKRRQKTLKRHLQIVQEILTNLEIKIEHSKQYMKYVESLMQKRLNQIDTYSQKSLINSEFVVEKNHSSAYREHYKMLKKIMNEESKQNEEVNQKLTELRKIFDDVFGENANKNQDVEENMEIQRGNIRFMIECELGEMVEKVMKTCQKISKVYHHEQKDDLYLSIYCFLTEAVKQETKHRQIGKSLLLLIKYSQMREKKALQKVKQCLTDWINADISIQKVFLEQLSKKNDSAFIGDYYDISTLTGVVLDNTTIDHFLTNIMVEEFTHGEKLKVCEIIAIFNKKIEANLIMTVDKYVHLFRLNSITPDFSFQLSSNISFKTQPPLTVEVTQFRKKYLIKKEKQFEFILEFCSEEDLAQFEEVVLSLSDCQFY